MLLMHRDLGYIPIFTYQIKILVIFGNLKCVVFSQTTITKVRILRDGENSSSFLNFPRGIFCHLKQMPQMCCNLSGATCPGQGKIPTVKTNSMPVMKNRIMFESWLFVANGVSVIGNIKNLHITDVTNYGMWVFLGNQIRFIRQ